MCGKTLDIHWLLTQGYQACDEESSEQAIQQLFQELGLNPKIEEDETFKHYSLDNIDIFVGDIFNLTTKLRGMLAGPPFSVSESEMMQLYANFLIKAP